jgi:hypothetical protein
MRWGSQWRIHRDANAANKKKRKKKKSTNKLRGEGIILLFFSTKDSQRKEALGM